MEVRQMKVKLLGTELEVQVDKEVEDEITLQLTQAIQAHDTAKIVDILIQLQEATLLPQLMLITDEIPEELFSKDVLLIEKLEIGDLKITISQK